MVCLSRKSFGGDNNKKYRRRKKNHNNEILRASSLFRIAHNKIQNEKEEEKTVRL